MFGHINQKQAKKMVPSLFFKQQQRSIINFKKSPLLNRKPLPIPNTTPNLFSQRKTRSVRPQPTVVDKEAKAIEHNHSLDPNCSVQSSSVQSSSVKSFSVHRFDQLFLPPAKQLQYISSAPSISSAPFNQSDPVASMVEKITPIVPVNQSDLVASMFTKNNSVSTTTTTTTTTTIINPSPRIYVGDNIHSYSYQIRSMFHTYNQDKCMEGVLDQQEWSLLLRDLQMHYGQKAAIFNFSRNFIGGFITDPDVPGLNAAKLLKILWNQIKEVNEPSLYSFFGETLDQISNTCIQGISHRLFIDYVALNSPDECTSPTNNQTQSESS